MRRWERSPPKSGRSSKSPPAAPRKKRQYARLVDKPPPFRIDDEPPVLGKSQEDDLLSPETRLIYSIVQRASGSIGGNGSGGAIYGELTAKSFQKIINFLKESAGMSSESFFLDVGSGLGKPNFHAAQDPGCVSIGIEFELVRWQLAAHNTREIGEKGGRVYFVHGDVSSAETLHPFTHVYMFDVGFPPDLFHHLSLVFNRSATVQWLISFQPARKLVEKYGFDCDLKHKFATSMHGSTEKHTVFFYQRRPHTPTKKIPKTDPLFAEAAKLVEASSHLEDMVERLLASQTGRPKRRTTTNKTPSPRC